METLDDQTKIAPNQQFLSLVISSSTNTASSPLAGELSASGKVEHTKLCLLTSKPWSSRRTTDGLLLGVSNLLPTTSNNN